MELKNCKVCGSLFLYNGSPSTVCPRCNKKEEEDFELVKSYLWDHPRATLVQVVDHTGVSEKKIIRYLKEGRIELADGSQIPIYCEICGKMIAQGRICDGCAGELKINTTAPKSGDKFFTGTKD